MYLDDSLTEDELIEASKVMRDTRAQKRDEFNNGVIAAHKRMAPRPVPTHHNAVRPIAYSYR